VSLCFRSTIAQDVWINLYRKIDDSIVFYDTFGNRVWHANFDTDVDLANTTGLNCVFMKADGKWGLDNCYTGRHSALCHRYTGVYSFRLVRSLST